MFDFDSNLNVPLFGVYGRPVVYSPGDKLVRPGQPIVAIFDREAEVVLRDVPNSEQTAAGHSTTATVLTVRLADFAGAPGIGDQVTVPAHLSKAGEGTWRVWDEQPDGAECVALFLRRV